MSLPGATVSFVYALGSSLGLLQAAVEKGLQNVGDFAGAFVVVAAGKGEESKFSIRLVEIEETVEVVVIFAAPATEAEV